MRTEWGLFQGSWADTWSQNARGPERNNKGHCFETFSLRSNIFNLGIKAMFSGSTPISPSISFLMAGDGVREMGAGGRGQGSGKSGGKTQKETKQKAVVERSFEFREAKAIIL